MTHPANVTIYEGQTSAVVTSPTMYYGLDESAINLQFYVPGPCQTAGSKTSMGKGRPTIEAGTKQSRAAKRTWRADIRATAEDAIERQGWERNWPDGRADTPLSLLLVMVRKRPAAHMTSGKAAGLVKDWARDLRPTTRPDGTKIARAAEDAMTSVCWADDSQVVDARHFKVFGDQVGLSPKSEGLLVIVALAPPYSGPMVTT